MNHQKICILKIGNCIEDWYCSVNYGPFVNS